MWQVLLAGTALTYLVGFFLILTAYWRPRLPDGLRRGKP